MSDAFRGSLDVGDADRGHGFLSLRWVILLSTLMRDLTDKTGGVMVGPKYFG